MGVMRFAVHPPELLESWPEVSQAFVRGIDGRVFPTKVEIDGNIVTCGRPWSDSGKLNIPFPVQGFGCPVLTTASLRERDEPYSLVLELARGKLSQVRDQWATWEMAKMVVPESFRELHRQAFHEFASASAHQDDAERSSASACRAIELACQAAEVLADTYVVQRMTSLRRMLNHPPSLLGSALDETVLHEPGQGCFLQTFNTATVPVEWNHIEPEEGSYDWTLCDRLVEFCVSNRIIMRGGPLIDLNHGALPNWLTPWKEDFLNLPSFVCDFIDTAVTRYMGLIRIWEVSTAGNTGGALDLNEEHRLSLVARTLETAIRTDSDSQFFIRIEQPWGEYQRGGQHRLAPCQFVDALIRSNLGITGVSLDLDLGYHPPGCLSHDPLSVSKLIDMWSMLGVQIHVNLACPSGSTRDPVAREGILVNDRAWKRPWSEDLQAEWMDRLVPMLMAKPAVTGVFLRQYSDSVPHRFPHAGLLSPNQEPKRMLESFQRQRQTSFH